MGFVESLPSGDLVMALVAAQGIDLQLEEVNLRGIPVSYSECVSVCLIGVFFRIFSLTLAYPH